MKTSGAPTQQAVEIELKLALPAVDPSLLEKQLSQLPVLARRKASQQQLHNTYYDTPEETLHHKRIALRIRRAGSDAHPQWLQTLKIGGNGDSALSRRGEWETAVPNAGLCIDMLKATPWSELDPHGSIFQNLAPRFTTTFKRTRWTVRQRNGSTVEVALDIGQIVVGTQSAAICELELELLAGEPAALFRVADQIASAVAVLPLNISKAERGYALAQNALQRPLHAQPAELSPHLPLHAAAARVLREMFCQFTSNLVTLQNSDDPEVIHQARIGWRRFKSGLKLFRKTTLVQTAPSWHAIRPLLTGLGALRDLDVANLETLPMLANAYTAGDPKRQGHWRALQKALVQATDLQRQAVRNALNEPSVGMTLLAMTEWLANDMTDTAPDMNAAPKKTPLRRWSRRRIARLHDQLKTILRDSDNPSSGHRARILAKQLRYSIEALRPLLPQRRTQYWYQQATQLQNAMGSMRDVQQALNIATQLNASIGLREFLRGVQARMRQAW